MNMTKPTILATFLSLAFAFTAHSKTCDASNPFWKDVSESSGCLPRPILLIHGLGKSGKFWGESPTTATYVSGSVADSLSRYFLASQASIAERDHNGIEFFNGINQASTPVMADLIADKAYDLLTEYYGSSWQSNPKVKFDIIAHSQGGVAIREALDRNIYGNGLSNPLNHIHHIITMGSPHLGTSVTLTTSTDFPGLIKAKNLLRGTETPRIDGDAWYGPVIFSVWTNGLYGTYRIKVSGNTSDMFDGSQFKSWGENVLAGMEALGPDLQKGSTLIQKLSNVGFPKRSLDNGFVPMTAMYSTVSPQFLSKLITPHWNAIKSKIIATGGKYTAGEEASEISTEMWQDIDPYIKGFDKDWSTNSDLVVEWTSAVGLGVFSYETHPFYMVSLGNDILHGSWRNPMDNSRIVGQEDVAAPALIKSLQYVPIGKDVESALILPANVRASTNNLWYHNSIDSKSNQGCLHFLRYSSTPVKLNLSSTSRLRQVDFSYKFGPWDYPLEQKTFRVVNENTGEILWSTTNFTFGTWKSVHLDLPTNTTNVRIEFSGFGEVKIDDVAVKTLNVNPAISLLLN